MPSLPASHHPACYPSDPQEALAFFLNALEKNPVPPPKRPVLGIISPHIDFRVSLRAYVEAFAPLLHQPLAETYLILGVGHRSSLEWNLDLRDYLTPLGRAENAMEWVEELIYDLDANHFFSSAAHRGEHSIEFPLLWLQALAHLQGRSTPIRFLPLLCGGLHGYIDDQVPWEDLTDFHSIADSLKKLLARHGPKLGIILSIDGCHQGPRFQHPYPVTAEVAQKTEAWEEELWKEAAKWPAKTFLDWFWEQKNQRYFDGVGALTLLLEARPRTIIERTYYEQWLETRDQSMVTFSSGRLIDDSPS